VARQTDAWRIIRRGRRRFSGDPRFNISFFDQGLVPRIGTAGDDTVLLQRICEAWSKAAERQPSAPEPFQPHPWWRAVQRTGLEPVTRALAARDLTALGRIYRNFFRDRCSSGLTGLPLARIELGTSVSNSTKLLYLIDALHRIDLWTTRTAGRFALGHLTPPDVGNPFGVVLGDAFVRSSSEDQHYCAHRIIELLGSAARPIVAEIGGGFGGMAGYLLRDCPGVTYVNFDLPETIALASYYLLNSFPEMKATLYGEAELNEQTLQNSQIVLMPGFTLPAMPARSVNVAFNARILSDLSPIALNGYLSEIARTTCGHLLHLNRIEGSLGADEWFAANAPQFELIEKLRSEWNNARTLHPNEMEYLYRCEASG
jgi:hypothetical protein